MFNKTGSAFTVPDFASSFRQQKEEKKEVPLSTIQSKSSEDSGNVCLTTRKRFAAVKNRLGNTPHPDVISSDQSEVPRRMSEF